jgi:hypothetical protein
MLVAGPPFSILDTLSLFIVHDTFPMVETVYDIKTSSQSTSVRRTAVKCHFSDNTSQPMLFYQDPQKTGHPLPLRLYEGL